MVYSMNIILYNDVSKSDKIGICSLCKYSNSLLSIISTQHVYELVKIIQ